MYYESVSYIIIIKWINKYSYIQYAKKMEFRMLLHRPFQETHYNKFWITELRNQTFLWGNKFHFIVPFNYREDKNKINLSHPNISFIN